MSDYLTTSGTTGVALAALDSNSVARLYDRALLMYEEEGDFWMEFEGKGPDSFIPTKFDTAAGKGHKITFRTTGGYGKMPVLDETRFTDDDYNTDDISSFDLTVGALRFGVRQTALAEEKMGLRGELLSKTPQKLGAQMGREKSYLMDQLFNKLGGGRNTMYVNGKSSTDALRKTDVLDYNQMLKARVEIQRVGGKPGKITKDSAGNQIYSYTLVGTTDGLIPLKNSSEYQNMLDNAGVRGNENVRFKGGYVQLDGQVIKERIVLDASGRVPIGSTMNPRARLGVAITAGTTEFNIQGGSNATNAAIKLIPWFRSFPKYAINWTDGTAYDPASDASFYVAIINPASDATSPLKWGFYKCDGNVWTSELNQLTVDERLGSASSGDRITTVGNVTWDADVNTDAHPVGSTIVLCNASAVPIGYSLMLGQGAAYRGYGMDRNKRSEQYHEGTSRADAFFYDCYIRSTFGQALFKDVGGLYPGFLKIVHPIDVGLDLNATLAAA